jgi:hypothetical protein
VGEREKGKKGGRGDEGSREEDSFFFQHRIRGHG